MKSNFWKRMVALACAGVLTVSGTSWTAMDTYAAEANALGVWNQSYSPSGYEKIKGITASAQSQHDNNAQEHTGDGPASYMVDDIVESQYHSHYSGLAYTDYDGGKNLTANNEITLTLPNATNISGITYLGRIDTADNGRWKQCTISVSTDGNNWKTVNNKQGQPEFNITTDKNNIKDEELLFQNVEQGVQKVKITVKKVATGTGAFISAAEVAVLSETKSMKGLCEDKLKELQAYYEREYVNIKDYDGTAVYTDEAVQGLISEATALVRSEAADDVFMQMIDRIEAQMQKTLKMFKTDLGTGYYASDVGWDAGSTCGYSDTKKDQDIDGNGKVLTLTVDGKEKKFAKGLGSHAADNNRRGNAIRFSLQGKDYKMFEASVGRQHDYRGNANVLKFEVYLNKNGEWELASESAINNANTSENIVVNLAGASEMALVSYGPKHQGHVNWADAKLYTTLTKEWANYTGLDNAIQGAEAKFAAESVEKKEWYEPESVKAFEEALAAAKTVNRNLFADQQNTVSEAAARLNNVIEQMKLKAEAAPNENSDFTAATYKVTTDKGFSKPFKYNEKCTLTPPAVEEGKTFAGWKLGEDVVYQGTGNYEFYVTGNYNFTAMYETVTVEPKAILKDVIITSGTKPGRSNIRFTAQIIVPQGKTLKKAGLMWGIDNEPSIRDLPAKQCNEQHQFSITIKNVPGGRSVHGYIYAYLNELTEEFKSAERKGVAPELS